LSKIDALPSSIDLVVITLHHPPVADVQQHIEVDHNPRPNEIALRDYLSKVTTTFHASFLVSAGHIHNYERDVVDGVGYLVSGRGGAPPHFVERAPEDLYRSILSCFPTVTTLGSRLKRTGYTGPCTELRIPRPSI
jgi:acid phosphatase type 7